MYLFSNVYIYFSITCLMSFVIKFLIPFNFLLIKILFLFHFLSLFRFLLQPTLANLKIGTKNKMYSVSKTLFLWCLRCRGEKDRWLRESCYIVREHLRSGVCACHVQGVYAITTDMYNDNVSMRYNTASTTMCIR